VHVSSPTKARKLLAATHGTHRPARITSVGLPVLSQDCLGDAGAPDPSSSSSRDRLNALSGRAWPGVLRPYSDSSSSSAGTNTVLVDDLRGSSRGQGALQGLQGRSSQAEGAMHAAERRSNGAMTRLPEHCPSCRCSRGSHLRRAFAGCSSTGSARSLSVY